MKATRMELAKLEKKIDDIKNRSKRNNIVIWGLREDAEKEQDSLELFFFFGPLLLWKPYGNQGHRGDEGTPHER